jgi:arylsulfatase A-like enzyme
MIRNAWMGLIFAAICARLGAATLRDDPAAERSRNRAKPNVVFILADDLGFGELGCYGQKKIRTPNIDRLAAQGMRFTRNYAGAPVCAPSRCALLTGLHTGHAQIRGNKQSPGREPPDVGQHPITDDALTLAEVLQRAGYVCGAMGKWGLGPVSSSGAPQRQGFDLFFGYNCQAVAHSYFPPYLWRNDQRITVNERPIPGHAKQPTGEVRAEDWLGRQYAPDLIMSEATAFIKEHRDKPFFLYLALTEPHVAMHPPLRLIESYPRDWDEQPYRGENGYLPHPRPRAAYAAMITSLDEHVGEVVNTLDECGLSDNTIVVFTSDNGTTHAANGNPNFDVGGVDAKFFESVSGLRGRKGSLYEGGIRVPLIVRWPGHVSANSISDVVSYSPDYFPTICTAAGIETPRGLDGINLTPTLLGEGTQGPRNPLVWVFPEYGGQVALRLGDAKIVRQKLLTPAPGPWEVYDLANDPNETRNLADDRADLIEKAIEVLRREVAENDVFPLKIPGIN